jgi:putative transposase
MDSYEDRIRAVEHYIKLGKRVRPTIRQLGYPAKNSLKGGCNEYQEKLDLPAGCAGPIGRRLIRPARVAVSHGLKLQR